MSGRAYYFIRANGNTEHDGCRPDRCLAPPKPTPGAGTYFNHVPYCLKYGVARIGWPDVGDLRYLPEKRGAMCRCYDFDSSPWVKPNHQKYLLAFRDIQPSSVVLLPDKDDPGLLHMGEVTSGYAYHYDPPEHPYECAHRVGVRWDFDGDRPIVYYAKELGIPIRGGFWLWAFHDVYAETHPKLVDRINAVRRERAAPRR